MRRVLHITGILLFVWASMMVGMILITLIIAFSAPLGGILGAIVVGVAKVALSAALAIFWLYLWSRVARAYFSWAIGKEKK